MLHLLRQPDRIARWFLLAALVFLLAACGAATPAITEAPTAGAIEATFTPPPTPEPTSLPAKVILASDAGSSPAELQRVETRLAALAAAGNSTLVRQESVTAADLTDDVKVVVWVGTAAGIADLAAGAPRVQFVAITPAEVQPLDNLSIIRSQPENAVFIAGYISTLIAPDWRGGALLPSDGPLGGQAQSIFTNGGRFFCGRCAPAYAPIVLFPVSAALPTGSPASAWKAAFSELNQNVIEVLYVSDAAASPELLTSLAETGITLLGSQPPSPEWSQNWAATVQVDAGALLETLWPDLLAGKGGQSLSAPVTLSDINPEKLSPGRLELVEKMIADLQAGLVGPYSVPAE